jgi:hypothetical protein
MTFVCVIPVQGGALELRVRAERGVWRWSICIRGGPTLEEGLSQTRTEAHVAAQFAVEQQPEDMGWRARFHMCSAGRIWLASCALKQLYCFPNIE